MNTLKTSIILALRTHVPLLNAVYMQGVIDGREEAEAFASGKFAEQADMLSQELGAVWDWLERCIDGKMKNSNAGWQDAAINLKSYLLKRAKTNSPWAMKPEGQ